ncbi:endoglucanase [Paenibacillus dendritiformis]|nr:endoglucanase [Paenibacillus dendritiformis]
MSLGAETVNAIKSLSSEALHEASESERQIVDNVSKALNAEAGESLRTSNPAKVYDHLQNIELARNRGAITEEDANTAVRNLLGAPGGDLTGELVSLNLPRGAEDNNFHVSGSLLKDPNGNPFVMRGVNNPHIWWDTESYNSLATIRSYGANSVRIVWETKGRAHRLKQILERCKQLKLVAIIELHDVTGSNDAERLNDMAKYFARDDISTVLKSHSKYALINIANEWGDNGLTDTAWRDAYKTAITTIRKAGLKNPIVIDGSGYGQNSSPIKTYGSTLLQHDPNKNVLFSIHMYGKWNDAGKIGKELKAIKTMGLCVIIGEFGYNYNNGNNNLHCKIDAFEVMKQCKLNDIGYLAWSWSGNNSENAWLDLVEASDWKTLTEWGDHVFKSKYGIKKTSKLASIF